MFVWVHVRIALGDNLSAFGTGSLSLVWHSPFRLDWLIREPEGPPCLSFSIAEILSSCLGYKDLIQDLMLRPQYLTK